MASHLKLRESMTLEQVFQVITNDCLTQIQVGGAGLANGYEPRCLHQMRVGLRRLRTALSDFREVLPEPIELRQELAWLTAQHGPARDWDVLIGATLPRIVGAGPDDIGLAAVETAACLAATAAREAAVAAVHSPRYFRLVQSCSAWVTGHGRCETMSAMELERLAEPVAKFGRHLLAAQRRRVVKRGDRLQETGPEGYHRLRLAVKRLHYTIGFFRWLLPGDRVRPSLVALDTLRNELGRFTDAAAAQRLLRELAARQPALAAGAGFVRGHLAAEAAIVVGKLRGNLKKFAALRPLA